MDPKNHAAGSPDKCAYRGCDQHPNRVRATASGALAHYCEGHGKAADRIFGDKP